MEEVDKILIQSLISIGSVLPQDIKSIGQFDQEMFIESVAKILNTINQNTELPIRLPPNTGVKYRICTKFATICQQLGYKNEIGYQTSLYLNEADMRRLLIFLVEKLTKELSTSAAHSDQQLEGSRTATLDSLISQRIKNALGQFWIPPYCKLNSLRVQEDNTLWHEGCMFVRDLNTILLSIPSDYMRSKSKYSQEIQDYFEKHCPFVSEQVGKQAVDLLTSLMQLNTLERLKEQFIFKPDLNSLKEARMNELKDAIRNGIKQGNELIEDSAQSSKSTLSMTDLAEIDAALESSPKFNANKNSRFTHSEKLQFTQEGGDQNVSVVTSLSEDKKDEEIKQLKENLEELNQSFIQLELNIKSTANQILQIEQTFKDQEETNKKLMESLNAKQKIIDLINDAPANILKLKEEIAGHEQKMTHLENQWNAHKRPLEEERHSLKQSIEKKKTKIQEKIERIEQIRQETEELTAELATKENLITELNKDMENNAKASNKNTNRQFYTKRILEIMANIDKQKMEINKILIETKNIQKEINQLSGKLERVFNETDELIFKDAKKDEANKKVYKLFITINENYDQLIKTIEESSHIERENRDLEDQVQAESQNKIAENMENVLRDFKQIKEENEQLMRKN